MSNTFVMVGCATSCFMDTVGSRLKSARNAKGWSQTKLAKEVGVSQGTIGNIESGARGGAESLARIAAALGVRYQWLDTGDGPVEAVTSWPLSSELLAALQGADSAAIRRAENAARAALDMDALPRESGGADDNPAVLNRPRSKAA